MNETTAEAWREEREHDHAWLWMREDVPVWKGETYDLALSHWLGTPDCPATPPRIYLCSRSEEDVASICLTPEQARKLASELTQAADEIDRGWK